MRKYIYCFTRGIFISLAIGLILVFTTASEFFVLLKPAVTFEELLDKNPEKGMHVKGEVCYAYDSFATKESYKKNKDGSRSGTKSTKYYYAIPSYDKVFALEIKEKEDKTMTKLSQETWDYLYGGAEPTTKIEVEGVVVKAEDEMVTYFESYLKDVGFTQEEIDGMGDVLLVKRYSVLEIKVMFIGGILLTVFAVFMYIRNLIAENARAASFVQVS